MGLSLVFLRPLREVGNLTFPIRRDPPDDGTVVNVHEHGDGSTVVDLDAEELAALSVSWPSVPPAEPEPPPTLEELVLTGPEALHPLMQSLGQAYQVRDSHIVVIVDNLVWSGRVVEGADDPATAGVREYLRLMWNDEGFVSSLMPVRDGVGLSVRVR